MGYLDTTHKETEETKRSRLNTFSQEYKMFRMKPREKILNLHKRFTHLTITWQPKVTAISQKKSLSKMSLAALFVWKITGTRVGGYRFLHSSELLWKVRHLLS
ncbi:hypothetical protein Lal_00031388 [Lupinus albus]|nr:hypothetical protein Lal_00031388 [Lupinus albus]